MTHPPRYLYVPGAPSLHDRLHGVLGEEGEESLFVEGECRITTNPATTPTTQHPANKPARSTVSRASVVGKSGWQAG
ncbi:hypothetical protein Pcinc_038008 [Petrolisthes cinctipes]|uniref:Uncharacterized protein n=1 Tax=Petrolisthes cinctipes TaxID=88211 RepID=A0AAE1EM10_PETCI|nr:hypothetical protein Pcinc_038008 [Petrolisthes cinctipes]